MSFYDKRPGSGRIVTIPSTRRKIAKLASEEIGEIIDSGCRLYSDSKVSLNKTSSRKFEASGVLTNCQFGGYFK